MERGKRCGEEALPEGTGGRKPEGGLPHTQEGRSFLGRRGREGRVRSIKEPRTGCCRWILVAGS